MIPYHNQTHDTGLWFHGGRRGGKTMGYGEEEHGNMGRVRNGSPTFYALLERMAKVHDTKSHDYANNQNPYGNYKFAGMLSQLFKNPDDAGFVGRIGEKLFRLSNLENDGKIPQNEKIEDTEEDICVIVALWMAARRDARMELQKKLERQTRIDRGISLPGINTNKQIYPEGKEPQVLKSDYRVPEARYKDKE